MAAAGLLKKKLDRLKGILCSFRRVIIAYSGGVDSTFLLKCAVIYLGSDNVTAVTAVSATYTKNELLSARKTAKALKAAHEFILTDELENPDFRKNPENRCYYCKGELFSKLQAIAKQRGVDFVLDGSIADDLKDYRPGRKAKEELLVRSPLAEAGMNKKEIRRLSKEFGLKTWDAPQAACLASRFVYGQEIKEEDLRRVEACEAYIRSLGFKMVRLRHYQLPDETRLARIEVDGRDIKRIVNYKSRVARYLKKQGYNYIVLDLEGYRTGSMNDSIIRDGS